VTTSELGTRAAQAALADAGMAADEIDYIVCATMTPDHFFPGAGTLIQQQLGIRPIPALDIRQQCAGFAYGLQMVDALIRSGIARNVLLVGTDVHTSLMPFSDRTWAFSRDGPRPISGEDLALELAFPHLLVLFGDAAGAMVFRAAPRLTDVESSVPASTAKGNAAGHPHCAGAGSARRPWVTEEQIAAGDTVPVMEGRQVFKLAVTRMPEATTALLARHGYTKDDLDLLVMHQANLRINEAAQKALGLPDAKVHNNIDRYGNTTSATLPLCFHEAREAGKAKDGSLVAFAALGAGLHWGAVLLRV
jgi:3-oxoacyl-[acyl-carrier-protein] synthase-3